MKRLLGIAIVFVLKAGLAEGGGGIGGFGMVTYDGTSHRIWISGHLDERFEIVRRGVNPNGDAMTYFMEPADFSRLQQAVDSRKVIQAQDDNGGTRSYRCVSGDQPQQVELIDRRAAIRSEVK
jgi:hypothetical protein